MLSILASLICAANEPLPSDLLLRGIPESEIQQIDLSSLNRFMTATGHFDQSGASPIVADMKAGLSRSSLSQSPSGLTLSVDIAGKNAIMSVQFDDKGKVLRFRLYDERIATWKSSTWQPSEAATLDRATNCFLALWDKADGEVRASIGEASGWYDKSVILKYVIDGRRVFDVFDAGHANVVSANGALLGFQRITILPIQRRAALPDEASRAESALTAAFISAYGPGFLHLYASELTYTRSDRGKIYVPAWSLTGEKRNESGSILGAFTISLDPLSKEVIKEMPYGAPLGPQRATGWSPEGDPWEWNGVRYMMVPSEDAVSNGDLVTLRRGRDYAVGVLSPQGNLVKIGDAVYRLVPAP